MMSLEPLRKARESLPGEPKNLRPGHAPLTPLLCGLVFFVSFVSFVVPAFSSGFPWCEHNGASFHAWRTMRSLTFLAVGMIVVSMVAVRGGDAPAPSPTEPHRSPIALALSNDGSRLLTANQTAGTVSLVDTPTARVLHEIRTGEKPAGVALSRRWQTRGGHALVRL